MNAQIAAIAKYFGTDQYTIEQSSGIVGSLRFKLARYEDSIVVFKYPHKSSPFKQKITKHQESVLNTLDGLFTFDKKSFLSKYSITHYVAVDKKNDNKVSFYTTYTQKKNEHFSLDIQVFGKREFHEMNFTIVSDDDDFYVPIGDGKQVKNLKEFFLIKNCRYQIKDMFGTVDDFNKDLIDMCFI